MHWAVRQGGPHSSPGAGLPTCVWLTVRESQDSSGAPLEKPRALCATMRIRQARVRSRVKDLMSTVGVRLQEQNLS